MASLIIPNEVATATYTVSAAQTVFPFPFAIFTKADLHFSVNGVELQQTDFTLAGTLLSGGGYQGGTINLNVAVSGVTCVAWRDIQPARATNFTPANAVAVRDIDTALNQGMAIEQDLLARSKRSLRAPAGETLSDLPAAAARAGKFSAYDSSGNPIASAGPIAGVATSAFGAALVGSATPAAGVVALGITGLTFTNSFQGGGANGAYLSGQYAIGNPASTPAQGRDFIFAATYNYVGGTVGATQGPLGSQANVGEGVLNFIWTFLTALFDKAPSTGQNVSLYAQATKQVRSSGANGTVTAACHEMIDQTVDPLQGSGSQELDIRGTGTDAHGNRFATHYVFSNPNMDNTACSIHQGEKFTIIGTGTFVDRFVDFSGVTSANNTYLIYHDNSNLTPAGALFVAAGVMSNGGVTLNYPHTLSASSSRLNMQVDGVTYGGVQLDSSTQISLQLFGGNGIAIKPGATQPLADNTITLGSAAARWNVVYAGTATINTSDARQKTAPVAVDDAQLDAIGDVLPVVYQYLDAVSSKGEGSARIHAGVTAQQLAAAYVANGLDPRRYGVFCSDAAMKTVRVSTQVERQVTETQQVKTEVVTVENGSAVRSWVLVPEDRPVYDFFPLFAEDGSPILAQKYRPASSSVDAQTGEAVELTERPEVQKTHAVTRMETVTEIVEKLVPDLEDDGSPKTQLGIRYDELSIMMHAWSRRELTRLEARVTALEGSHE